MSQLLSLRYISAGALLLMLRLRFLQGDLTQMVDIEVAGEMETLKNTVGIVSKITLCHDVDFCNANSKGKPND